MKLRALLETNAPPATILIRAMVGVVFFAEGVQKFLYPATLGAGRFAKIGIPAPELLGPFVGGVETVCGLLVLAGWMTRTACVALAIDMLVAIVSTKIPILLGYGFWGFSLRKLERHGLMSMLHESRTDLSMLCGSLFLIWVGAGPRSLDAWLVRRAKGVR